MNASSTILRGLIDNAPFVYVFNSSGVSFTTSFANLTIISTGASSDALVVMNATTTFSDGALTSLQGSAFKQLAAASGVYSTVLSRLRIIVRT